MVLFVPGVVAVFETIQTNYLVRTIEILLKPSLKFSSCLRNNSHFCNLEVLYLQVELHQGLEQSSLNLGHLA
jgi:hypothetical protein